MKDPLYQKRPTIEDLAMRRNQKLSDLIADFQVSDYDSLVLRCEREGLSKPERGKFDKYFAKETASSHTVQETFQEQPQAVVVEAVEIASEADPEQKKRRKIKTSQDVEDRKNAKQDGGNPPSESVEGKSET